MVASDKTKTRTGAITLLLGFAVLAFAMGPGFSHCGARISLAIEFDEVGALTEGADVMVAGRAVGTVKTISLTRDGATAHIEIEKDIASKVPRNADVHITSKGLFSTPYIELGPAPAGEKRLPPVADGDSLRGVAPVRIELVVLRSIENTKRFRELLIELRPVASEFGDALDELSKTLEEIESEPGRYARLRASTSRFATELGEARKLAIASDFSVARIEKTAERASRVAGRLSATLLAMGGDLELLAADLKRFQDAASAETLVKLGVALARAERLVGRYRKTIASLEAIASTIDRGEGTVGGLLHDPEFIDEAKQLGRILKRQPWKLFGTNREKLDLDEP